MQLHELGVNLEQEDNAAGFLGVMLEQDSETGLLEMKKTELIKQVIKALGLDDGLVKGKYSGLYPKQGYCTILVPTYVVPNSTFEFLSPNGNQNFPLWRSS